MLFRSNQIGPAQILWFAKLSSSHAREFSCNRLQRHLVHRTGNRNTLCTYPLSSQLWKPEHAPTEQVVYESSLKDHFRLRASRTRLTSRAAERHKNRWDGLSPTEHWRLWTDFLGGTGPSLPINSAIGSFPFHAWACDLFTTLSGPLATVFRPLTPIQYAAANPHLT